MQVSVESTTGLERKLTVQVPAAEIDAEVLKRLQRVGRTAKIKGFRPGKAPMKVLKQQYGAQVHQEVIGEIIQRSYGEALQKEDLNPAGNPRIEPASMAEGQDLEYTATFEVYPEVTFAAMDKITVERPAAEIADADVDEMIETLRAQRKTWAEAEEAAGEGDRITIDFEGKVDGELFDGGKAENYAVELGAGRMLADFEAGITGMKAGETKDIDVNFPGDYHAENLKGKAAVFAITARKVEKASLPEVDAEFVKSFGVEEGGIDAFREEVRGNMTRELEQTIKHKVKEALLDALVENNPVDLPAALVDQEVHRLQHDAGRRMGIKDHSKLPSGELFQDQARKRVAVGLLMSEVITQNNLELDPARVDAKLEQLTADYDDAEAMIKMYRENAQAMTQVQNLTMEEQVVDWLMEQVTVSDKPTSFKELMNLGG